jgi:hypothetical protein
MAPHYISVIKKRMFHHRATPPCASVKPKLFERSAALTPLVVGARVNRAGSERGSELLHHFNGA